MTITIPQFESLFGSLNDFPVIEGVPNYLYGRELGILDRLVSFASAQFVLEIGVQNGLTAKMLLDRYPQIALYVGVDLPPNIRPTLSIQLEEHPKEAAKFCKDDPRFSLVLKDSKELKPDDFPIESFNLIFIDGGHDYETVTRDTWLARELVAYRGVIVWHDYKNPDVPDVEQAINDCNQAADHIIWVADTTVCFQLGCTVDDS